MDLPSFATLPSQVEIVYAISATVNMCAIIGIREGCALECGARAGIC